MSRSKSLFFTNSFALVATFALAGCGREVPSATPPSSSAPAASAPAQAAPIVRKAEDMKYEIQPVEIPTTMKVAEPITVKARLINKGQNTWASKGEPRVQLAYHWADPEGTGNWTSVVWDDKSRGELSKDVAPGESIEVSMPVKSFGRPAHQAKLVIVPFLHDVNFCTQDLVVSIDIVK